METNELRRARDAAGLTSAQMAARLGVNVDTYRSWELGRRTPREDIMASVRALAANEPLPKDEIGGLRALVNQLAQEVQAATAKTAELALIVARHEAELRRLQAPQPRR